MKYTVLTRTARIDTYEVDLDFPVGESKPLVMDQMVRQAARTDPGALLMDSEPVLGVDHTVITEVWRGEVKIYPRAERNKVKAAAKKRESEAA